MFFKKYTFGRKFFISIFTISSSIFIIAMYINTYQLGQHIIANNKTSMDMNIRQTADFVKNYIQDVELTAQKVSLNKEILFSEDKYLISRYLEESYNISPNTIQTIYFYYNGNVYSNNQLLFDLYGNDHLSNILPLEYTPSVDWHNPYSTLISKDTIPLSYCVGNRNDFGVIIIDLNCANLQEHFNSVYKNEGMGFIMFSQTTNTYFNSDLGRNISGKDYSTILNTLNANKSLSTLTYKKSKHDIFYSNPHKDFSFYILKPNTTFQILYDLIINSVFTILIIILFLSLLSYFIAKKITNPITRFSNELKSAYELKELPPIIINTYQGELHEMVDRYNDLSKQISILVLEKENSILEKNKYELQMLQHQIGPHFLHNTLICIGSLAKRNQNEQVVKTLQSLLSLLSYSFNNPCEEVTLEQELDSVKNFTQICEIRYYKKFNLNIDIHGCEHIKIPKLIFQPLVENAIYHGILPKDTDGEITISAKLINQLLKIIISDDGIGMSDIKGNIGKRKTNPNHNMSVGLYNVIKRLKLHYKEHCTFDISSDYNQGTQILIEIKLLEE